MKLQAVKTTGIYCRADCRARPNAENVQPIGSAIIALAAGFRPCLICRPDRLPEIGLEQPAEEIAHAVKLIAEGFLDNSTTEALAMHVGYSPRHLNRLFEQHVGASPDFVARARRAHLARRLLDESDLSITNIAFAAGFSSVRQMNRVMKELFAFRPSELRSKRRKHDPLDSLDGGLRLRVPFDGRLDPRRLIEYLGPRSIPGVEEVVNGCYRRTMNDCGFPGVVEVRASDRGDCRRPEKQHVEVTMHLATFGSIIDQVERVRSLFAMRSDGVAARGRLGKDKILGALIRKQSGIRMPGAWDRFETAIRIIIGQQVSVVGASTLTGRLVKRFGERIDVPLPGSLEYLFPAASTLAESDVRDLGMPEARAKTIKRFSMAVATGEIDLTSTAPMEDTIASLVALAGIGPWTAHFIAGRVMGYSDAFPDGDLGLRKSAALLLGRSKAISSGELFEMAEAWRPYRFSAATYLWMASHPKTIRK